MVLVWQGIEYQGRWNIATTVEGDVIDVKPPPPEPFPDEYTIDYSDSTGKQYQVVFKRNDVYVAPQVGEKVEIRFLPDSPGRPMGPARFRDAAFDKYLPLGLGVMAAYCISLFAIPVAGMILRRLGRQKRGGQTGPNLGMMTAAHRSPSPPHLPSKVPPVKPHVFLPFILGLTAQASAADVDYLRDVKPILAQKCFACHGALKQESGLRVDTAGKIRTGGDSGAAIVMGKPVESLLLKRVSDAETRKLACRRRGKGKNSTSGNWESSKLWIEQGARDARTNRCRLIPAAVIGRFNRRCGPLCRP